jgi:molybdenum cofactor cytidylyltransferase
MRRMRRMVAELLIKPSERYFNVFILVLLPVRPLGAVGRVVLRQISESGRTDNSNVMEKTSVLILAAGLSTRMGQEKFALEYGAGATFLEHIVQQYHQFGCRKIVVVVNPRGAEIIKKSLFQFPCEVETVVNAFPEGGRFTSVKTGLKGLQNEDFVFLQNIDNPDIHIDWLAALLGHVGNADFIYPVFNGKGGHPVLITGKIVQGIINEKADNSILKDFLSRFKKSAIEITDAGVLTNINTADDYHGWKMKAK